jgi:DNA-binding LacI/PurR family transcriptional regulator
MARLGGATMDLQCFGTGLPADLCVRSSGPEAYEKGRALLARKKRPTAVLALWTRVATGLVAAARDLGLKPGKDFEMVGWARKEEYLREYKPAFPRGRPQPAIVWNPDQMAELAIERLGVRRTHPELEKVKLLVPVELV